jgi:hypothetical protein
MDKPFTRDDLLVIAACEFVAIPLCDASWHAIVVEHDALLRGIVGLGFGLVIGIAGLTFHWWKDGPFRQSVRLHTARWWPILFLASFVYFVGPNLYERVLSTRESGHPTGRIVWNFEQTARGLGFFITLQKIGDQEIRVIEFGAQGKNNSGDPISQFSGYMRSDRTNAQIPIYILAQSADEAKIQACFQHPWIPTLPEETFGIPPFADFQISTREKAFIEAGKDGVTLSKFINDFVPFTIVLEYDGMKIERKFSREEVNRQVELFEKSLNPLASPYVLRRASARAPELPPLPPLIPPMPSLPPLKPLLSDPDYAPTGSIPR